MRLGKRALLVIFPVILIVQLLAATTAYMTQRASLLGLEQARLAQRLSALKSAFLDYQAFNRSALYSITDSEALLALPRLAETLEVAAPKALILRGEGGREYLADTLRCRGVQVDSLELYRRYLPDYPCNMLIELVRSERLNAMVVSSGQGLQSLRELAGFDWSTLRELPLFVPSPRVAEMAEALGAKRIVDCRGAGTAALLAALRDNPGPAS